MHIDRGQSFFISEYFLFCDIYQPLCLHILNASENEILRKSPETTSIRVSFSCCVGHT